MTIDILKFTPDELDNDKLDELIKQKASFQVISVTDLSRVVETIEGRIENENLKCRVYTEYRAEVAAGAMLTGIGTTLGVVSAVGIGIHRLATYNPDYEIAKNIIKKTVTVQHVKSV